MQSKQSKINILILNSLFFINPPPIMHTYFNPYASFKFIKDLQLFPSYIENSTGKILN